MGSPPSQAPSPKPTRDRSQTCPLPWPCRPDTTVTKPVPRVTKIVLIDEEEERVTLVSNDPATPRAETPKRCRTISELLTQQFRDFASTKATFQLPARKRPKTRQRSRT